MSNRRSFDEDFADAEDRNRGCRRNDDNVAGAMDRNDRDRNDDRRIVINANEVTIRANRVNIVEEDNRRRHDRHDNRRCHCRRCSFW
jgi:hypothetical protein